ncbi:MAG: beta-ketoacyl-ACP synthase II [Treponema sp.]|nr:beta-ketoacyl-ACP synthase II [Treponema sp.]
MERRRVVITGMGAITPLGNSVQETWEAAKAGKSGVATITHFDASTFKTKYAAEVKGFSASNYMDENSARKMARFAQYAVAATKMALEDAELLGNEQVLSDAGVFMGVGIGGFEVTEDSCIKYSQSPQHRCPPMTIPELIPNEACGNICMQFGIHGPSHTVTTACSSSTDAIGDALDCIRSGRRDVCIAGGAESTINGFAIAGFEVLHALSQSFADNPTAASRPFDKKREGFVMGEGSAVFVLESYEHAVARGARMYAELAGYGGTSDGYHLTAPNPDGVCGAAAMTEALKDAGVQPAAVQYYNAHGTSTPINDPSETRMLKMAFGEEQAKHLHISSTKSMTGHCLGAAGAIEAMLSIMAIRDGFVPPTINLDEPDVEAGCDLDYTPNKGISANIDCAMSATFGFGGHNGVVVLKRV